MTDVVPVLDLLDELAGSHKFRNDTTIGSKKERGQANCVRRLAQAVRIKDRNGELLKIPAETEVVIYRHPRKTREKQRAIACFHFPDSKRQVVIYVGGIVKVQELDHATVYDSMKRRTPGYDLLYLD